MNIKWRQNIELHAGGKVISSRTYWWTRSPKYLYLLSFCYYFSVDQLENQKDASYSVKFYLLFSFLIFKIGYFFWLSYSFYLLYREVVGDPRSISSLHEALCVCRSPGEAGPRWFADVQKTCGEFQSGLPEYVGFERSTSIKYSCDNFLNNAVKC